MSEDYDPFDINFWDIDYHGYICNFINWFHPHQIMTITQQKLRHKELVQKLNLEL